jgi:hypothetical protein
MWRSHMRNTGPPGPRVARTVRCGTSWGLLGPRELTLAAPFETCLSLKRFSLKEKASKKLGQQNKLELKHKPNIEKKEPGGPDGHTRPDHISVPVVGRKSGRKPPITRPRPSVFRGYGYRRYPYFPKHLACCVTTQHGGVMYIYICTCISDVTPRGTPVGHIRTCECTTVVCCAHKHMTY